MAKGAIKNWYLIYDLNNIQFENINKPDLENCNGFGIINGLKKHKTCYFRFSLLSEINTKYFVVHAELNFMMGCRVFKKNMLCYFVLKKCFVIGRLLCF